MSEEKSFCNLPFLSMLADPKGDFSPCCWQQNYKLGKISENGLMEAWNGEQMQALREEFLSGNVRTCAQEIRHIGCHKFWDYLSPIVERTKLQNRPPRKLDLRLNGRCNLECQMCDVWTQPNGLFNDSDLWERGPTEIFPYLVEMDILGGEPFMQKDTYRLIREVSAVNPKCRWAFVTNGQWKFNQLVRDHLDRIEVRWMVLSLDSLDPVTYSVIRKKGKLENALKNLEGWLKYREEVSYPAPEMSVGFCVQPDNWREAPKFVELAKKHDIRISYQWCYEPFKHSLGSVSLSEQKEALEMFEEIGRAEPTLPPHPITTPLKESIARAEDLPGVRKNLHEEIQPVSPP